MNIYKRAEKNGCHYESNCTCITQTEWDRLMKGARPANQKKVIKVALKAGIIDEDTAYREAKNRHYNPYKHYQTKTHIIYVNSAVEHFIAIS